MTSATIDQATEQRIGFTLPDNFPPDIRERLRRLEWQFDSYDLMAMLVTRLGDDTEGLAREIREAANEVDVWALFRMLTDNGEMA